MRLQTGGKFLMSNHFIGELLKQPNPLTYNDIETDQSTTSIVEPAFEFILGSSVIERLEIASRNGIVYKLTLKEGVESPYVKLQLSEKMPPNGNFGNKICSADTFYRNPCFEPINVFLIKLSLLHEEGNKERSLPHGKYTDSIANLKKEAEIQNNLYEKTFELGESIIPACSEKVIIRKLETGEGYDPIIKELLMYPSDSVDYMLKDILNMVWKENSEKFIGAPLEFFGCFLMEFAEGFQTFADIRYDSTLSIEDKKKAYALMRLGHLILYQNLYWHGDCHLGNVMINLNYTGFFSNGEKGKVFLIDFNRTVQTPTELLEIVERKVRKDETFEPVFEYASLVSKHMMHIESPSLDFIKFSYPGVTLDLVKLLLAKRKRKANILKLIESAIPDGVKQDDVFLNFLRNPDFRNLNYIRWKDYAKLNKPEGSGSNSAAALLGPIGSENLSPVSTANIAGKLGSLSLEGTASNPAQSSAIDYVINLIVTQHPEIQMGGKSRKNRKKINRKKIRKTRSRK